MAYRPIALMGKAGSGKDEVARRLVRRYGYTQIAFADPIKELALKLDPWIITDTDEPMGVVAIRLSQAVSVMGWDKAKDTYPYIRRMLQEIGSTVRQHDPDFWLRALLKVVDAAERWNMPVVVSDVRYPNEADALKARGFRLVLVYRPGSSRITDPTNAAHESEHALTDYPPDALIYNGGSLNELYLRADALVTG